MATYVNVTTVDRGNGDFTVSLATGQPLVQGISTNSLEVLAARAENRLSVGSAYAGNVQFDGSDSHEYTVEVLTGVNAGVAGSSGNPTFRVSLDGGKTWLRDDNGAEMHYEISSNGSTTDPVQVKNLKISSAPSPILRSATSSTSCPKLGCTGTNPHGARKMLRRRPFLTVQKTRTVCLAAS